MNNPFLEEYKRRNLRACQLKQLSILEEIDSICKQHDIPYWLDGGTLLGNQYLYTTLNKFTEFNKAKNSAQALKLEQESLSANKGKRSCT